MEILLLHIIRIFIFYASRGGGSGGGDSVCCCCWKWKHLRKEVGEYIHVSRCMFVYIVVVV